MDLRRVPVRDHGVFSLSISNFGAMAMDPVASVAGIGASLQGFVSTLGGALVGALIGRQFNGTAVPLTAGLLCCGVVSLLFVLLAEKGRLFRGHHSAGEPQATPHLISSENQRASRRGELT